MNAAELRDALFMSASRTYAEQYIEPLVRSYFKLGEPSSDDYDAIGPNGTKFEIKASKVTANRKNSREDRSLLARIEFELRDSPKERCFPASKASQMDFLANIQNVKRDHFDELIYCLLFSDVIQFFFLSADQISKGSLPSWSDKHGRYDALGKSGQFPVTKSTIAWHRTNALRDEISYEQALEIYREI